MARIESEIPFTKDGCPPIPRPNRFKETFYQMAGLTFRRARSDQCGRTLEISRTRDERRKDDELAATKRILKDLFTSVIWPENTYLPGPDKIAGVAFRKSDTPFARKNFLTNVQSVAKDFSTFLNGPFALSPREGIVRVSDISTYWHVPNSRSLTDILGVLFDNKNRLGQCLYPTIEGPAESLNFEDFLPLILSDRIATVLLALEMANPTEPNLQIF